MRTDNPEHTSPRHRKDAKAEPDVISDPAKDNEPGHDWTSEGGATPTGPATDADPSS